MCIFCSFQCVEEGLVRHEPWRRDVGEKKVLCERLIHPWTTRRLRVVSWPKKKQQSLAALSKPLASGETLLKKSYIEPSFYTKKLQDVNPVNIIKETGKENYFLAFIFSQPFTDFFTASVTFVSDVMLQSSTL